MRFVLFVLITWPLSSFLILFLITLQAEYGGRGPQGEYLIDLSNPLWLVLSGFLGLLAAVALKLLLFVFKRERLNAPPN